MNKNVNQNHTNGLTVSYTMYSINNKLNQYHTKGEIVRYTIYKINKKYEPVSHQRHNSELYNVLNFQYQ